jgi:hypothetical protein
MTRQFEMRELAAHELDEVAGGNPIAIGLIVLGAVAGFDYGIGGPRSSSPTPV